MERQKIEGLFSFNLIVIIAVTLLLVCRVDCNHQESLKSENDIAILYDSTGIDKEFQVQLLNSVETASKDLFPNSQIKNEFSPHYIDVGELGEKMAVKLLKQNQIRSAVSLLAPEALTRILRYYEDLKILESSENSEQVRNETILHIVTPRVLKKGGNEESVKILSMQMSEEAICTTLLHRIRKTGVKVLIPILDDNRAESQGQLELLEKFKQIENHEEQGFLDGDLNYEKVEFSPPILVSEATENYKNQSDSSGGNLMKILRKKEKHDVGILLLAKGASRRVIKKAREAGQSGLFQMRWFAHDLIEYEEWAMGLAGKGRFESEDDGGYGFGIYSVLYVGAKGWENNPSRKKALRDMQINMDPGPRIISSILAYDALYLSKSLLENSDILNQKIQGLSGELSFDSNGHRSGGTFFGISSVPKLTSPSVTLLQKSTWILEDVLEISSKKNQEDYFVTAYSVATSTLLTKQELLQVSDSSANLNNLKLHQNSNSNTTSRSKSKSKSRNSTVEDFCDEHLMEIVTRDPFSQMLHLFIFEKQSLPEHLLIPNEHGYGITFICGRENRERITLKISCAPALRTGSRSISGSAPVGVKCFRSRFQQKNQFRREKRQTRNHLEYYYKNENAHAHEYAQDSNGFYYKNNWDRMDRDDKYYNYYNPVMRITSTLPPPRSTSPGLLPEIRRIIRVSKPFVGSCVGSSTGCAMCVLFLGRLGRGTRPTACIGSCAIGIVSACNGLMAKVFSEKSTVICTELFRQGLLDMETLLADAEFGRGIQTVSPLTMKGYHLVARPLVRRMRRSKEWTEFISMFALPWAKYMKYVGGYSDEFSLFGCVVHNVGSWACFLVGLGQSALAFLFGLELFGGPGGKTNVVGGISCTSILLLLLVFFLGRIWKVEKSTYSRNMQRKEIKKE